MGKFLHIWAPGPHGNGALGNSNCVFFNGLQSENVSLIYTCGKQNCLFWEDSNILTQPLSTSHITTKADYMFVL